MCYTYCHVVIRHVSESLQDLSFINPIEGRSCLVHHQNFGVFQKGTSYGDPLLLTS